MEPTVDIVKQAAAQTTIDFTVKDDDDGRVDSKIKEKRMVRFHG